MSTDTHTHDKSHGGPAIYTANLLALMFLTVITVAAASFNFGSANVVIALAIASVKAILVGLFFMHLLWDKPVNAIILVAAFLFLGIFLMFDFLDVTSRNNFPPRNLTPMENATPVPDSMNPLKAAPPKPLEPAKPAEENKAAEEHK